MKKKPKPQLLEALKDSSEGLARSYEMIEKGIKTSDQRLLYKGLAIATASLETGQRTIEEFDNYYS